MKKITITVFIISLVLGGCQKEKTNYAELLVGTWINTKVDGQSVLTNNIFVCEFLSNGTEVYSSGVQLDESDRTWIENDNYTYTLDKSTLNISGSDDLSRNYSMEFEIQSISNDELIYTVTKFSVDNEDFPDPKTYTCKKVGDDLSDKFIGKWYGKCTSAGTDDTEYHFWEYFSDGNFNYYYQDEDGNWIVKTDNDGGYFLYGNLFVSNFTNDLESGSTGKAFESWEIEISGNHMIWTGLRENDQIIRYEMDRAD